MAHGSSADAAEPFAILALSPLPLPGAILPPGRDFPSRARFPLPSAITPPRAGYRRAPGSKQAPTPSSAGSAADA